MATVRSYRDIPRNSRVFCDCAPPRSVWKENKPIAANQASYGTEPGVSLWAFLIKYEVLSRMQCLHVKARRRDRIFGVFFKCPHKDLNRERIEAPFSVQAS